MHRRTCRQSSISQTDSPNSTEPQRAEVSTCRALVGRRSAEFGAALGPDLRPALKAASEEELVEIFRAFDLTITYDKPEQRLHLAATITPELLPVLCPNESDRPEGRSQINDIAGAGFEPATFGL
jgi:hypothetical protein